MRLERVQRLSGELWSEGRGWILVFIALGWALSLGSRYIFPVMFPHLRDTFNIGLALLGTFYTLLWVSYALLQFAGGILADRYGERTVLVLSTLMTGGTMLFVGSSNTVSMLAIGMILFGLASALYGTTRYTVLVDIYPRYDSTAVGITQSAGEAGNTLLPVIASFFAAYTVWQLGFVYVAPLFVVVAIGLWVVIPKRTSGETSAMDDISITAFQYILANIRAPQTLTLAAILTLTMFVIQGVSTFYPTYLIDLKGFSPTIAAVMFGFLFISAGIMMPLSGFLADSFSVPLALAAVICSSTIALLLFPFVYSLPQLILITALFSSIYGVLTIAVTEMANTLPKDMRGTGLGVLRTGYILFAATGSLVVGTLAEYGLFDESFFVLALITVTAVILTSMLTK